MGLRGSDSLKKTEEDWQKRKDPENGELKLRNNSTDNGQSVLAADKKPLTKEESAKVIEAAIREAAGELTKADLEKVTHLYLNGSNGNQLTSVKGLEKLKQLESLNLWNNQLTDVKGLEKLTQLESLYLNNNPDLTKAQIVELQKALPKCKIASNPTK